MSDAKVYIVTNGDYSDYSVVAAFKLQPTAEQFANLLREGDVLEMELLSDLPRKVVRYNASVERHWREAARRWGPWGKIKAESYDVWDFEVKGEAPPPVVRENFINAVGYESADRAVKVVADMLAARANEETSTR